MVNVLILEDDADRIEQFKKNFKNCNIIIESNAYKAITILEDITIKYLFLDHDLGDENLVGSGYTVAKFLYKNEMYTPKHVYIHSANIVGAKNMKNYLPSAIIVPMVWKKEIFFT